MTAFLLTRSAAPARFLVEAPYTLCTWPRPAPAVCGGQWNQIPAQVWRKERERAQDLIQRDVPFIGVGYDIDEDALTIARENAAKAGVSGKLRFERRDIGSWSFPGKKGVVICNPPYGGASAGSASGSGALPGDGAEVPKKKGLELYCHQPGGTV